MASCSSGAARWSAFSAARCSPRSTLATAAHRPGGPALTAVPADGRQNRWRSTRGSARLRALRGVHRVRDDLPERADFLRHRLRSGSPSALLAICTLALSIAYVYVAADRALDGRRGGVLRHALHENRRARRSVFGQLARHFPRKTAPRGVRPRLQAAPRHRHARQPPEPVGAVSSGYRAAGRRARVHRPAARQDQQARPGQPDPQRARDAGTRPRVAAAQGARGRDELRIDPADARFGADRTPARHRRPAARAGRLPLGPRANPRQPAHGARRGNLRGARRHRRRATTPTCARNWATCSCTSSCTRRSPASAARSTSTPWPRGSREKMIRRHPHVFGDDQAQPTARRCLKRWDEIKREEKGRGQPPANLACMAGPAGALPALMRAQKAQEKAAQGGLRLADGRRRCSPRCARRSPRSRPRPSTAPARTPTPWPTRSATCSLRRSTSPAGTSWTPRRRSARHGQVRAPFPAHRRRRSSDARAALGRRDVRGTGRPLGTGQETGPDPAGANERNRPRCGL